MIRQEFEVWIKENHLVTVHTYSEDYTYVGDEAECQKQGYGVFRGNDGYVIRSYRRGERGPERGVFWEEGLTTEEEAFDALRNSLMRYAVETYNHSLKDKVFEFYQSVFLKKIQTTPWDSSETDISYEEYIRLVDYYFSDEFYAETKDCKLKVYSSKFRELIFEIESYTYYEGRYSIPLLLKFDGNRYLGNRKLNHTFREMQKDKDAFYLLYYNSLVAFEKYDYRGNKLYDVEWTRDCDLRNSCIEMSFINTEFVSKTGCHTSSARYSDNEYISVTNGLEYAIYDRTTGTMVENTERKE